MRTFGWTKPVRGEAGGIIGSKSAPVKVRTVETLGHSFGCDHNKRLVITCHSQDLIGLRPERTQREVKIKAVDVYRYVLKCLCNFELLERARASKARKARRLAARRLQAAEKRLTRK